MPNVLRDFVIGKRHYRSMKIEREKISEQSEMIPMTFSSNHPVVRWWGVEVLAHTPEAMKLDRWKQGAPFLKNHDTYDQRGIILDGDYIEPYLQGNVKFSKNPDGQALRTDIVDGICPYTSVGYDIIHMREMQPAEMTPDVKDLCLKYECKAYLIDEWEPVEGSSVWLGANPNVGARDLDYRDGIDDSKIAELLKTASEEGQRNNPNTPITIQERGAAMPEPKSKEQIERERAETRREIEEIGRAYESRIKGGKQAMDQLVEDAVKLDRSVDEFRGVVFMRVDDGKPIETPVSLLGMSQNEVKRYSVSAALNYLIDGKGGEFERECSEEISKRTLVGGGIVGRGGHGGLLLPYDVQQRGMGFGSDMPTAMRREIERVMAKYGSRAQSVGSDTGGGYLVGTENRPQDFISLLKNALIQGVRYLPGLSSNVQIPKQTGGASISIAATEGADYGETSLVFGQISLMPHDVGAWVEIDRRLLIQANPAIDNLVSYDLIQALALTINRLMMYGSGSAGQPLGALLTPNIGTFNGASITWQQLLEAISDIGTANVSGLLEWLMNSTTQALLMGREKSEHYPVYLMDEDGKMAGKSSQVTEQMADGDLVLGKLDEIVVAEFGMMELNYDRSSLSKSGGLRIAIYHSMDSALRNPGALTYASDLT